MLPLVPMTDLMSFAIGIRTAFLTPPGLLVPRCLAIPANSSDACKYCRPAFMRCSCPQLAVLLWDYCRSISRDDLGLSRPCSPRSIGCQVLGCPVCQLLIAMPQCKYVKVFLDQNGQVWYLYKTFIEACEPMTVLAICLTHTLLQAILFVQ